MHLIADLFLTFFKIGSFTFGGGLAMISIIEDICVERKQWITHEEMMNIAVIAESTPGPIAINCATYVGAKRGGFAGSVAATVGIALPSFLIIWLISGVMDHFLEYPLIANALRGIKIGVGLLILRVGITMAKKLPASALSRTIAACACAVMLAVNIFSWNISTISLLLLSGAVSFGVFILGKGGDRK